VRKVAPPVFTIPPEFGFADTLAEILLEESGGDPVALAHFLILVPNRRASRALREAFLRRSGDKPMLLPRMRTVDDADEDELAFGGLELPPAIPKLNRIMLLARLVMAKNPDSLPPNQAVRLAAELAGLLDSLQIERIDPARLSALAPENMAAHWQETLEFLSIVFDNWPKILAERGLLDPQERTNLVMDAQARSWSANPPQTPVIAAGSTGTRPATAYLLKVVMGLPKGRIVLPGLDLELDSDSWEQLDEVHPQYGMKRLLDRLGVSRSQVQPVAFGSTQRAKLLTEIMRPAPTTHAWRRMPALPAESVDGIVRIDAPTPRDEAGVIALVLRDALETPGRTAALVTPDRGLAARVRGELLRWDIRIDDSAGRQAGLTEPGAFLTLLARAARDRLAPHALLSLLKHPLAAADMEPSAYTKAVHLLELKVLRGPRPKPGLAGLRDSAPDRPKIVFLLDQLAFCLSPFLDLFQNERAPLLEIVTAHLECAERLASIPGTPGPLRLWQDDAGEVLARFAAELTQAAPDLGAIDPAHYPGLFEELLADLVVRPKWGTHPRLFLWGPIEARLQRADVMVLAGLNEGVWQPDPPADPWMSRPMRTQLGLPLDERRIGLSAHDFCQGLAAPTVYLTRSIRVEGTPTKPARWLLRMETVLAASTLKLPDAPEQWLHWFKLLDAPEKSIPVPRPAPRPPVAARPRDLYVTAIEAWMRDPYGFYAKHILRLRALDPIDAERDAADYGTLIHGVLESFLQDHPGPLPINALDLFLERGRRNFAQVLRHPDEWAFWWPRFESIARWVIDQESARRPTVRQSWYEVEGKTTLAAPAGPFTLKARADRLDLLRDGTLAIIDYKTGKPPPHKEIAAGFAPQLPLEAAIAFNGGFVGAPAAPVSQLLFWYLKGGAEGGKELTAGNDPASLARDALEGVSALIAAFDDPDVPYEARPYPAMAPKYSDYGHLARIAEWSSGEDDGGDE